MARTSNVFARVEPELKEQAETVLNELGIPMSNAISIFLKQVVLQRGIPFEIKLPAIAPVAFGALTKEQFDSEIEKGITDYRAGKYQNAADCFGEIESEYDL
jgi:DNA-damage-inducible protein J